MLERIFWNYFYAISNTNDSLNKSEEEPPHNYQQCRKSLYNKTLVSVSPLSELRGSHISSLSLQQMLQCPAQFPSRTEVLSPLLLREKDQPLAEKSCFRKGQALSCSYLLKTWVTSVMLNGIRVNLFLDSVTLSDVRILTTRITEEFNVDMPPITLFRSSNQYSKTVNYIPKPLVFLNH